jgi:hemerythrin superfamily protein
MDAITLLKADHKAVGQLFRRFEKSGSGAHVERREIVDGIIEALSVHAAIEEELFYPVVRATVPDTESLALESLEEHHIVKWVLSELESMSPEDERFEAKVTVLIENVRHHIEEEESDLFPKVREELGRKALGDLGDALVSAKATAPTHPHPRSPDTPPGNLVMGATAALADRVGDRVSGLAQGGMTAATDLIAAVLRTKKPKVSPRGPRVARRVAKDVRARVSKGAAATTSGARPKPAKRTAKTAKASSSRASKSRTPASPARALEAGASRARATAKRAPGPTKRAAAKAVKGTPTAAVKRAPATRTTAKRSAAKRATAQR